MTDFTNIIYPRIKDVCAGEVSVITSNILQDMDAYQVGDSRIFSRVQYNKKRWPIFVIKQFCKPGNGCYLVNAYIKDGEFDYACMCEADRLLNLSKKQSPSLEALNAQKWNTPWADYDAWYEQVKDGEAYAIFTMKAVKKLGVTVWSWAAENDDWIADYDAATCLGASNAN